MIVINLSQLLAVLGSILLVMLIIAMVKVVGILSELKGIITDNRGILHNTLSNVDEISTSTKDVYGAVTGKITNFVNKPKKEKIENIDSIIIEKDN